jgi:hypothetical protein
LSDENRKVHWYGVPIYLLVLNFASYQFRGLNEEDEETTTITSTIDDVKNSGLIAEGIDESETTTPFRIHVERRKRMQKTTIIIVVAGHVMQRTFHISKMEWYESN